MIDLDRLASCGLADSPWRWAQIRPSFLGPPDVLVGSFPADGFAFGERTGQDKAYAMSARPVIVAGEPVAQDGLAEPWRDFLAQVAGDGYRTAMRKLTGIDLSQAALDVTFWRYDPGCWLSPHPDKADKLVSQVFYMNTEWDERWGGWLGILRSGDADSVVERVAPRAGTSVVIVRSADSWHMVAPVSGVTAVRRSVQVVFRRPAP